ncbi:MAG: cyclase family protein [Chloroflexi bacterium]|nr:cyclase family protein [Chloroflexota bacterium]
MADIVDISLPLRPNMPIWPGSVGLRLTRTSRLEAGDSANVSRLDCDVHVGTHVDAPWHFWQDGATVEQLPLDVLIGPATVAYLPQVDVITAGDLADLALPPGTERLLLRTRNSELWMAGVTEFREDYVALTADAARWVVDQHMRLIGVDYLSVQRYQDGPTVHQILLGAEVVIIEGLNLSGVESGEYELICLPLKILGAEGAPARAILRPLTRGERDC